MSLVFTLPGKLGDALLQWPVAYHYCKENDRRCVLWLDEHTLKPLEPLFAAQPCVEAVELKGGITSWHMGGQPWDFALSNAEHLEHEIHHLGMRKFPQRQITLEALEQVPLHIDAEGLGREPSLVVGPARFEPRRRVVIHANFVAHSSGVPSIWRFLADARPDLEAHFEEIAFIGSAPERARAREIYPGWTDFDDQGDFLQLAAYLDASEFTIGCGSCGVVLASLLAKPALRVHDDIGGHPKVIWSNLGPNQWNETERELRVLWPGIRDRVLSLRAT